MIKRLLICWRLRRDFDADLMRYRGCSTEQLAIEHFTLRVYQVLGRDRVRRAVENMARAIEMTGVTMQQAADAFNRVADALSGEWPKGGGGCGAENTPRGASGNRRRFPWEHHQHNVRRSYRHDGCNATSASS